VFADIVSERRRSSRAEIAAASDSASSITVGTIALVVFLAPAAILFAVVAWIRRRMEPLEDEATDDIGTRPAPVSTPRLPQIEEAETEPKRVEPRLSGAPMVTDPGANRSSLQTRSSVARHLVTLDRIRTGTLTLVTGRLDLAPIAGRVAGQISDFEGLVDVLARRVDVEADPLRVDDILNLLLSASIASGADKLAVVVEQADKVGTVAVAGAGVNFSPEALEAISDPDESEDPVALQLAVASQLAQAMGGALVHEQLNDMTLLTVELPLADR
jgi:HAMP domain-containing protein